MLPGPTLIITCPKCNAPHRTGTLQSGNTFGAVCWSDGKMVAPMMPEEPTFTKCSACGTFCWVSDMLQIGTHAPWDDSPQREPLSFNVSIGNPWDDEELVVKRWAAEFGCSLDGAQRALQTLPIALATDVDQVTVKTLTNKYEELGVTVETTPCRVSTEPVPQEWTTAPVVDFLTESETFVALDGGLARTADEELLLRVAAWHAGNDGFRDGNTPWTPYAERNGSSVENLERLLDALDKTKGANRLMSAEICRQLCRFDEAKRWLDAVGLKHATYQEESEKEAILDVARVIRELADSGESALSQLNLEHG